MLSPPPRQGALGSSVPSLGAPGSPSEPSPAALTGATKVSCTRPWPPSTRGSTSNTTPPEIRDKRPGLPPARHQTQQSAVRHQQSPLRLTRGRLTSLGWLGSLTTLVSGGRPSAAASADRSGLRQTHRSGRGSWPSRTRCRRWKRGASWYGFSTFRTKSVLWLWWRKESQERKFYFYLMVELLKRSQAVRVMCSFSC